MWEPVTAEHKPVKHACRQGGIALLVSAVLIVLLVFARPKWQTVRLWSGNGGSTLLVQVPQDWQGLSEDNSHSNRMFFPTRPTGLVEWWDTKVLKMDLSKWNHADISIIIEARPASDTDSGHRELESVMHILAADRHRSYRNVKMAPITQADMAGYDLEALSYTGNLGNEDNERYVMLNHYDPVRHRSSMITVILQTNRKNYSLLKPTMDEIIRRLRLVQNK